jgi:hypothetical protein
MFARLRSSRGANLFAEILMIVIGINIALWFEGLAEDYQDAETGRQYLSGLHDDLALDVKSLDQITREVEAKLERLQSFIQALDTEYIPIMMRKFDIKSGRITDPSLVEDQVFINFYPFTLQDAGTRLVMLKQARAQASELMQAIEDHLDA